DRFSGPQHGAVALGERVDDARAQGSRLLVRERALGGAERDAEGERALALAGLRAAVLVERLDGAQLGAGCLANRGGERGRGHGLVDDERKILPYLRVRAHVLVEDRRRRLGDERLEVELERSPGSFEQRRVELADPAAVRPRGRARMEERLV